MTVSPVFNPNLKLVGHAKVASAERTVHTYYILLHGRYIHNYCSKLSVSSYSGDTEYNTPCRLFVLQVDDLRFIL